MARENHYEVVEVPQTVVDRRRGQEEDLQGPVLSLDQVKEEIRSNLQNQRTRDAMDKYQNSFQVDSNPAYFGPSATSGMRPGMPPPRGAQRPGTQPAAGAPPQQPPSQKPDPD